jgi:hypothetical protein
VAISSLLALWSSSVHSIYNLILELFEQVMSKN